MARLTILHYPDSRLRKPGLAVEIVDDGVRALVADMLETMYAAPGIGLAATQVNVQKRIVVMDVSEEKNQPLVFINPTLLEREGEGESEEGCLSVPGFYETVRRAERVRVSALDRDGEPFELDASGLLAVCIQHEIDHLDGKLFVDYLSALKRDRIRKKLEKQSPAGNARVLSMMMRPAPCPLRQMASPAPDGWRLRQPACPHDRCFRA
jgi:peptide deformylase